MKRLIPCLGALTGVLWGTLVCGAPVEGSRYRVILDRKPFGSETPPSAATGGPGGASAVEPFIKFIKISAFVRDDFSPIIRVGLIETRGNQSYLLAEGESADGLKLVRAEFERERVLISKDNLAYWLTMDGTFTLEIDEVRNSAAEPADAAPVESVTEPTPSPAAPPPPPAPTPLRSRASRVRPAPVEPPPSAEKAAPKAPDTPGSVSPRRTLTERRRMIEDIRKRREELAQSRKASPDESAADSSATTLLPVTPVADQASTEIPRQLEGSEMDRQLQEYQIQAIREGREPLPIPLTPEADEQLVREGLLPPAE